MIEPINTIGYNIRSKTKKQLDDIINSDTFEVTVAGLAKRNPYFARVLPLIDDPIPWLSGLCNATDYAEDVFEKDVSAGWGSLENLCLESHEQYRLLRLSYHELCVLEEEPLPVHYTSIMSVLNRAGIQLDEKQEQAVNQWSGEVSDEECHLLVLRYRQLAKTHEWKSKDGKRVYLTEEEYERGRQLEEDYDRRYNNV